MEEIMNQENWSHDKIQAYWQERDMVWEARKTSSITNKFKQRKNLSLIHI